MVCLNTDAIMEEERYDGFYAVCTNRNNMRVEEVVKINGKRWEIEECFRIMKTEFKARPVYLQTEAHIRAHFLTCFMALMIYRILEKKLKEAFTCGGDPGHVEKYVDGPSWREAWIYTRLHQNRFNRQAP